MIRPFREAGVLPDARPRGCKAAPALAALLVLLPVGASAQQGGRSLGVLATHSVSSRTSAAPTCCDGTADVLAPLTLSTLEVELTFRVLRRPSWGLEYPLRGVPLALARNNPKDAAILLPNGWSMPSGTPREPNVGAGVKPLGLRAWVGGEAVRLEAEVSSGILFFASPMLAANATHLNFVAEADVGVRIGLDDGRRIVIGYRRHHLSNAGLGEVNPGLNSHVVYVGLRLD